MRTGDLANSYQDVVIHLTRRGFLGRGLRFSIAIAFLLSGVGQWDPGLDRRGEA